MTDSCSERRRELDPTPCAQTPCCAGSSPANNAAPDPMAWFGRMIPNCLEYATAARQAGQHVVGIMCEYTPRELIMAAGGVPVCLCGGSEKTVAAAEERLPANLCPLIKSTFGYHLQKSNPFLEMAELIVAETTCDGKKKMYELMAESRPMYVLELPQKPDDADAFAHWLRELEKFRSHLEQLFQTEITDDKLRQAIGVMNRERQLRRRLAEFMAAERPPLTGRQLLDLNSSISGIPADFTQYEAAIELLQAKTPPRENGVPVRVLMTGVPMAHGSQRVLEIIEDNAGLVVCMESCVGLKPILEDVDEDSSDPLRAVAEKYFHLPCSVMTRNDGRLKALSQLAQTYRPECVVELIWQACLTYDVESARIKQFVENELSLPYLRIETDYSPSDSARIGVRIEALLETVRSRRSLQASDGA